MKIFGELFKGFKKMSAICLSGVILVSCNGNSINGKSAAQVDSTVKRQSTLRGAGLGALLGAGLAAAAGGSKEDIAKFAALGAGAGAVAGNARGQKQKRQLQSERRYTDRLVEDVARANEFNRRAAAYNQDLNKQITAIEQMQDDKRALALTQAKRAEVAQNLRDIDERIARRKDANVRTVQDTILQLTQERKKLQRAADRLRDVERNKGG